MLGRSTTEKDYTILKEYSYDYNTNGNVYGKTEYPINTSGKRTDSNGKTVRYTYGNNEWPDQLTTYNGQTITYDNSGNPLSYVNGLEFTWSRGRKLTSVALEDNSSISYKYNENGLRTYKDASDVTTVYEGDESILLRETVTYKSTSRKVDIWYLYDGNGSVIGFEYSYTNFAGTLVTARIYYEKNLQGDVIGLLDARGAEIATYTYDAWGNVTSKTYVEGNEIPYELNHITYRGYYRDDETGFVRTVLSAISTKVLIIAARAAIVLMTLQQYIAVIANIVTIVSIVLTVKNLHLIYRWVYGT